MAIYSVKVDGVATGTSALTYKTILGLKMPNTTGAIARLRKLIVAGSGAAAQDLQVDIKLMLTDISTDGTSTSVNVNTILSHDALQRASALTAIGKNYSAAPTTFGTAQEGGSFNSRGTLVLEWPEGKGLAWGKAQLLAILGTMGAGSTAVALSVTVEWEE